MLPELHTPVPGPRSLAAAEKLRRYESRNITYLDAEFPVFWQRAEGVNVWDVDGNRFLDWTSAFGVAGLGHTAPAVREALVAQAGALLHGMGDVHPTPLKADLCERLSALTFERWGAGSGKTILGNSGFEAVEAALKTALLYSGKPGVLAFRGAYHGLGYGALEVAGTPFFREPFRPQLKEFATLLPYPSGPSSAGTGDFPEAAAGWEDRLEAEIDAALRAHPIGAILVEPIQGRGGEIVPPRGFLPLLRRVCDERGLLLVADEIYTGFNRTGALFACEHSGVVPDVICLGKGLTSGFPLSACVGRAEVMDAWPLSAGEALHTSTFLGNPLGCAMALASLKAHADPALAARVRERGERLKAALRTLPSAHVTDVRGTGLLVAAEFDLDGEAVNGLVKQALRDGLIFLQSGPAGNVLAFTPPFAIADEEIAFTVERLRKSLGGI
ncbi:MAG: aspartate aminotransferase family protein [Chthoniobacteraceae bacterium]|nr:aspartate aminotransferase family protein [Chthoniobacteraceae bacterium]